MANFITNWHGDYTEVATSTALSEFNGNMLDALNGLVSALDSVDESTLVTTNTTMTASLEGGGHIQATGTHLLSTSAVINSLSITLADGTQLAFSGTLSPTSGDFHFNSLSLTTPTGDVLTVEGSALLNNSSDSITWGEIDQISTHLSAGHVDFVLQGDFTFSSQGGVAGNITDFQYEDASGHSYDLSGFSTALSHLSSSGNSTSFIASMMSGNDHLTGTASGETLVGFAGNDIIDGAGGTDSAGYSGVRANYSIHVDGSTTTVTDHTGTDGTDTLTNIEQLWFSDMHVNLQIGDKAQTISTADLHSIEQLYVAFFNRVPDADGLGYWIDAFKGGMTLGQICDNFYTVAATNYPTETGYSATMSNDAFVRIVYANVLGRSGATAPPDGDVQYWSSHLTSCETTKGALVATMLTAARDYAHDATWYWVSDLLDNKITVADYFAVQQGLTYNTPSDSITHGMTIAAAVTATDTAAAIALIGVNDSGFSLV